MLPEYENQNPKFQSEVNFLAGGKVMVPLHNFPSQNFSSDLTQIWQIPQLVEVECD